MKDLYKNDIRKPVDAAVSFFFNYLEETKTYESPILKRINEKRIKNGEVPKVVKTNSDTDIYLFVSSLRRNLYKYFEFRYEIVLINDYNPMWILEEVFLDSQIENLKDFEYHAHLPSKLRIVINYKEFSVYFDDILDCESSLKFD